MDSAKSVISRLAQVLGAKNYDLLAEKLDVARSTLNGWGTRGSIPYEKCVEVARSTGTSLDWLLIGRGPMLGANPDNTLVQRVKELEAELAHLRGSSDKSPAKQAGRDHKMSWMWRVLESLAEGEMSEKELATRLAAEPRLIQEACIALHRQALIRHTPQGWALAKSEAVLRANTDEDVAFVGAAAMRMMAQRVLPGAADTTAAVVIVDLKVADALPGQKVMAEIRRALESVEDPQGERLRIVIGVALVDETSNNVLD